MKRFLILGAISATALMVGCAGQRVKNEFTQKRGYSAEDMKEIQAQRDDYAGVLAKGRVNSNAFNTTEKVNAENRIKSIFCACHKKLGDKCTQKVDGLSAEDHSLWVKSNAAEWALAGMSANDNPLDSKGYVIDPVECK